VLSALDRGFLVVLFPRAARRRRHARGAARQAERRTGGVVRSRI